MRVPVFKVCQKADNAVSWAKEIGYPVAAKVVPPNAMHKCEVKGAVVVIGDDDALGGAYQHFRRIEGFCGMLVEKMIAGVEVIIGAKIDYKFGPIILMGIGGTAVRSVAFWMNADAVQPEAFPTMVSWGSHSSRLSASTLRQWTCAAPGPSLR